MKHIIQISLGPSLEDDEFETDFQGNTFHIQRFGTDGNCKHASDLLLKWNKKADAIALGSVDRRKSPSKDLNKLLELGVKLQTPVTTGATLRTVGHEWSLRHIQFKFGNNYFNNACVLFFCGVTGRSIAKVMSEYTQNMLFADPLLENGIPRFISNLKDLALYTNRLRGALNWIPGIGQMVDTEPMRALIDYRMRQAHSKETSRKALPVVTGV